MSLVPGCLTSTAASFSTYQALFASTPGNRLYQEANGTLHLREKTLPEILLPSFLKVLAIGQTFFRFLDKKFSNLLQILPGAAAQSAPCEWGQVEQVLMHQPGNEVEWGVYHATAALFEKPFHSSQATAEHQSYVELLRQNKAQVKTVVDILLQGTMDAEGNVLKDSKELKELREFAKESLTYKCDYTFSEKKTKEQEKYLEHTIEQMHPNQLVNIIFNKPTITLTDEKNKFNPGAIFDFSRPKKASAELTASYQISPVMNLYFLRDQMITTAKGVVLSKMSSPQRAAEVPIIKFVLAKMGITPLYEVTGDGSLEGGDFLPAGNFAFIGQGLRTNAEAIQQLLQNDVFGVDTVIVVKDSYKNQDQMHLDTYFNIIAPRRAVLIETRMHAPGERPQIETRVDLWTKKEGGYVCVQKDLDFADYLQNTLSFELIPVSNEDQLKYGINFLTVRENKLLGIDGVSQEYKDALKQRGVDVTWMDFTHLKSGFGAAHCTTQVLERDCSPRKDEL